jgi:hypothetical protein
MDGVEAIFTHTRARERLFEYSRTAKRLSLYCIDGDINDNLTFLQKKKGRRNIASSLK